MNSEWMHAFLTEAIRAFVALFLFAAGGLFLVRYLLQPLADALLASPAVLILIYAAWRFYKRKGRH